MSVILWCGHLGCMVRRERGPAGVCGAAILLTIARDSPRAAKRVRVELRAAMARLAEMPTMGHFREDLISAPLRFWSVYSYLIVYDRGD